MTVRRERDDDVGDETGRNRAATGTIVAWILGIVAVIALIYLFAYLFGAFDDDDSDLGETDDIEVADVGISVADVIEDPERYLGEDITVDGFVDVIVDPRSFTITNEDIIGESLLVVGTEEIVIPAGAERPEAESEPIEVQVTGTVYMFGDDMLDDVGDAYEFMYEEDAFNQYEGEPVLLVDDVEMSIPGP